MYAGFPGVSVEATYGSEERFTNHHECGELTLYEPGSGVQFSHAWTGW